MKYSVFHDKDNDKYFMIVIDNDNKEEAVKHTEHKNVDESDDNPDYKKRMQIEYRELKERYNKLHNMIVKYEAGTLDFEPNCSIDILKNQKSAMGQYLYWLEVRAQIENVEL